MDGWSIGSKQCTWSTPLQFSSLYTETIVHRYLITAVRDTKCKLSHRALRCSSVGLAQSDPVSFSESAYLWTKNFKWEPLLCYWALLATITWSLSVMREKWRQISHLMSLTSQYYFPEDLAAMSIPNYSENALVPHIGSLYSSLIYIFEQDLSFLLRYRAIGMLSSSGLCRNAVW